MSTRHTDLLMGIAAADGVSIQSPPIRFDGTNAIAATTNSVAIWSQDKDGFGIQVSCPSTGTPNGSVSFQSSNDKGNFESKGEPDPTLTHWSTQSFWDEATATWVQSKTVAGAASFMFTIPVLSGRWLRMVWTNTSGSALLTVHVQVKSDGGR